MLILYIILYIKKNLLKKIKNKASISLYYNYLLKLIMNNYNNINKKYKF